MASNNVEDPANLIKQTHSDLRKKCLKNEEKSWDFWHEHVQTRFENDNYAKNMQKMAQEKWKHTENDGQNRVNWVLEKINLYFTEKDHLRIISRFLKKSELKIEENLIFDEKLSILDVGSCYNPFSKCKKLNVTAIDLAPATEDVLKCDFLSLKVDKKFEKIEKSILEMPKNHFDVVIFCLLLEYLPLPSLRFKACQKAFDLLKTYGILFIVTPDSSHHMKNMAVLRKWKIALASLGLIRVYYEKLKHVHCMGFIKTKFKDLCDQEIEKQQKFLNLESINFEQLMVIPQDDTSKIDLDKEAKNNDYEISDKDENLEFFDSLPCI